MKYVFAILAAVSLVCAQEGAVPAPVKSPVPPELQGIDWVCPMDKDVHSTTPGVCPRCGMKLVPWIPEPDEYPVVLTTNPRVLKAGEDIQLDFKVEEPHTTRSCAISKSYTTGYFISSSRVRIPAFLLTSIPKSFPTEVSVIMCAFRNRARIA